MRLLIIEDDFRVARFLKRGFEEEGFSVSAAADGNEGLRLAAEGGLDCMVLDLMLPGIDGLSICRALRGRGNRTPILMLTVKGSTGDKVEGLSAGADDYLAKPFSFDELLARVHALIRRRNAFADHILRHRDLELDLLSRKARRGGEPVELSQKEFALLEHLVRRAGEVVSERELIEKVWGLGFDPKTNIVNVYLHHLRSKIEKAGGPRLIQTVRGKGFLLGEAP
jgi:two-component system OmpR family response regulator